MASVLDSVDQRTQLVGENRLELLLFRLTQPPAFAINVFKVREVQQMPELTKIPDSHSCVRGVTHCRGTTVPVIDLGFAIGMPPIEDTSACNVIITEYNRSVQGFMVTGVDRIINLNWDAIEPPPKGTGNRHYLTAITRYEDGIIEIIDVEKVLQLISPYDCSVSDGLLEDDVLSRAKEMEVLVVDDSCVARGQVIDTLNAIGFKQIHAASDGMRGLKMLKTWADEGEDVPNKIGLVITDAEMPEMDGYRMTSEIRADDRLKDLHVIMHTSLSGKFNEALVDKVGCDGFISKFQSDELASIVQNRVKNC